MLRGCRKKPVPNRSSNPFERSVASSVLVIIMAVFVCGCSSSQQIDPDEYIKLGQYKGLHVDRSSYEVTEEAMQDELEMLANAYADPDGNVPEITDEFIREISEGSFQDLAAYKAALADQMRSEYDEFYDLQYYEDLWNLAVDNAEVIKDFPPGYLQEKTERSMISALKYAKSLNMSFDDFVSEKMGLTVEEFNSEAIEYAKVAAKESMVCAAIAKAENITVSDEDIEKAINEYVRLGAFESREAFEQEGPERMEELKEYILTSKVQDLIAEYAK